MAKKQTAKPDKAVKPAKSTPSLSPAAVMPQSGQPPEVLGVSPPVASPPVTFTDIAGDAYEEGDIQNEIVVGMDDGSADAEPPEDAPEVKPAGFVPFLPVSYSSPHGTPDLRAKYVLPPPVTL